MQGRKRIEVKFKLRYCDSIIRNYPSFPCPSVAYSVRVPRYPSIFDESLIRKRKKDVAITMILILITYFAPLLHTPIAPRPFVLMDITCLQPICKTNSITSHEIFGAFIKQRSSLALTFKAVCVCHDIETDLRMIFSALATS